jgi:hypothetical protein
VRSDETPQELSTVVHGWWLEVSLLSPSLSAHAGRLRLGIGLLAVYTDMNQSFMDSPRYADRDVVFALAVAPSFQVRRNP